MRTFSDLCADILNTFKKHDSRLLRKLNDEILAAAAINYTDPYLKLAIFAYVLSKIISKPRFLVSEHQDSLLKIEKTLGALCLASRTSDDQVLIVFSDLEHAIAELERGDSRFVTDLMTKGKLKVGATLYAQGMSLGVASERTQLEKQEILDYAGETMMFDRMKSEKNIVERMRIARKFLSD